MPPCTAVNGALMGAPRTDGSGPPCLQQANPRKLVAERNDTISVTPVNGALMEVPQHQQRRDAVPAVHGIQVALQRLADIAWRDAPEASSAGFGTCRNTHSPKGHIHHWLSRVSQIRPEKMLSASYQILQAERSCQKAHTSSSPMRWLDTRCIQIWILN